MYSLLTHTNLSTHLHNTKQMNKNKTYVCERIQFGCSGKYICIQLVDVFDVDNVSHIL